MHLRWQQIFVAITFGSAMTGAQTPPHAPLHKETVQESFVISQYMREMGLTYVDEVGKMEQEGLDDYVAFLNDPLSAKSPLNIEDNIYGKALVDLEDRIEINSNSEGDRKFLALLKKTKSYASIAFSEQKRKINPRFAKLSLPNPSLADLYLVCMVQAKAIAKAGVFEEGDCSQEKFSAALAADKSLQTVTQTQPTATVSAGADMQALIANSAAGTSSKAAMAATATVGHAITPEELTAKVSAGEASRCAVITDPAGAEIDIDGNKAGVSPMVFTLLKKDTPRMVTVKMSGYKTVVRAVVPDGKEIPLGLTLEKETQ